MQTPSLSTITDKLEKSIITRPLYSLLGQTVGKELLKTLLHKNHVSPLFYNDKLKDIKVQSSAYGKVIPKIYGTVRISGNIIWAQPIRYTQHRESYSSSLSNKNSIFTNCSATFALAICSGPLQEIKKVWANGHPLDITTLNYRFYPGTEEQAPDPLIFLTEGCAPAYRGLAYVVIEDMPLQNYNNSIPNFVFEITSYPSDFFENHVTKKIESIYTIGSGEFAYDTKLQRSTSISQIHGKEIVYGNSTIINGNKSEPYSISGLNTLRNVLPNVQWIAVTVHWFADNVDIKECHIYPSLTYDSDTKTYPDEWYVGRYTKNNSLRIVSTNNRYKHTGTPNDASLTRYLQELKSRQYKVLLSLKLVVASKQGTQLQYVYKSDSDQDDVDTVISDFFSLKYLPFLEHYCALTKGMIDALVIGGSFSKLTQVRNKSGEFPAVNALINLAHNAKQAVNSNVVITYAADCREYHSYNGMYNMDPLWASDSIDVVGIKAYFPLLDGQYTPTIQDVVKAWKSGEGYDYFYTDDTKRKVTYRHSRFAWKNIQYWWENFHTPKNGRGKRSPWVPLSKKIWFVEYGFRSVENCTNARYISESDDVINDDVLEENADFAAQRTSIEGTLQMWESSPMVERMFLYAWNIKLPDAPSTSIEDYRNWLSGYWINKKIDTITVGGILQNILKGSATLKIKSLNSSVSGYLINNQKSIYEIIKELQKVYFFHITEGASELLVHDKCSTVTNIPKQDIISQKHSIEHLEEHLRNAYSLSYISMRFNYQPRSIQPHRSTQHTFSSLQIPIVLDDIKAEHVVDLLNLRTYDEKSFFSMVLPLRYISLKIGDVVSTDNGRTVRRITDMKVYNKLVYLDGHSYTSCIP